MRGEDPATSLKNVETAGSPPHARGRRRHLRDEHERLRITPACAGKTNASTADPKCSQDHPRMRGEDVRGRLARCTKLGSPPHARGRLILSTQDLDADLDHPRMRGEDSSGGEATGDDVGSPPHARGRPVRRARPTTRGRITPACAGKTPSLLERLIVFADHPRMRGED